MNESCTYGGVVFLGEVSVGWTRVGFRFHIVLK